jgi:hypothetical protein
MDEGQPIQMEQSHTWKEDEEVKISLKTNGMQQDFILSTKT